MPFVHFAVLWRDGLNRRGLILMAAFVPAALIAFLLRDVVVRAIIIPIAYLWWILKLYYSAFPQYFLWLLLILISFFWAVSSLAPEISTVGKTAPEPAIVQGQIAGLAGWLNKSSRGGIYYKWLIANRLGKNGREILIQREGQAASKKFGPLKGQDWRPTQEIDSYLEAGLNGSFADYPQPRAWERQQSTPLDIDPKQVLDYLENELETQRNGHRKSF